MGRNARPIDLVVMDGKSHKTKEEIRQRKENEIRPDSDNVKCPSWLCDVARQEWERIEHDLKELGLLTNIDTSQLAIYCDAYAKYVQATNEISNNGLVITQTNAAGVSNTVTNPHVQIATKYAEIVKKFCDSFGLSPSARARMAIPKGDPKSNGNSKEERFRGLI